jgi:hypothetical protein
VSFRPSFDSHLSLCTSALSGRMGFYLRSAEVKLTNCKAFFAGGVTGSDGHGFMMEGPSTLEESTNILSACAAQDNKAYGFLLRNRQRTIISGSASSNSVSSVGTYTGVGMLGIASLNIIDVVCTERVAAPNNSQQNALFIESGCSSNQIRLSHGATAGSAVGTAIKSGSDLTGGNSIYINGSGLGTRVIAGASGTVTTPDPYIAMVHQYTLTGNVTSIPNPANQHQGCELEVTLVQDGTGSRTATNAWGTQYRFAGAADPTLTTTANRRDTFRFRSNGTNWYEINRVTNVEA